MRRGNSGLLASADELTIEDLGRLLKDRTLVDYFNVFLSLPVFTQRVIYKFDERNFEFDPPPRRTGFAVDYHQLSQWLVKERLPHFVRSELYVEYLLCRQLIATRVHTTDSSHYLDFDIRRQNAELGTLERRVGNAVGICQFRHYLRGTPGLTLIQFWLDVERLKRIHSEALEEQWLALRELQLKYFSSGALGDVKRSSQWSIISKGSSGGDGKNRAYQFEQFLERTKEVNKQELESRSVQFQELQNLILAVLRQYWLPKYSLHLDSLEMKRVDVKGDISGGESVKAFSRSHIDVVNDPKDVDKAMNVIQGYVKNDDKVKQSQGTTVWKTMFPEHVVDDSFMKSNEDVITLHEHGVVTVDKMDPDTYDKTLLPYTLLPKPVASTSKTNTQDPQCIRAGLETTSMEVSKSDMSGTSGIQQNSPSSQPLKVVSKKLSAKKEKSQLPKRNISSNDIMMQIARAEACGKSAEITLSNLDLFDQLLAATGLDFTTISGDSKDRPTSCPATRIRSSSSRIKRNIQESHDLKAQTMTSRSLTREDDEATVHLPSIFENRPLVSVQDATSELQTLIPDPSHISTQLSELPVSNSCHYDREYRNKNADFIRALVADRLSGGPMENYVRSEMNDKSMLYLMKLWQDTSMYLATKVNMEDNVGDYLKFRRAKILVCRYLIRLGNTHVDYIPPGLRLMLQRLLVDNKGDCLLRQAQDIALKRLNKCWRKFSKHDRLTFTDRVIVPKKHLNFVREALRAQSTPPIFAEQEGRQKVLPQATITEELNGANPEQKTTPKTATEQVSEVAWMRKRRAEWTLQLTMDISDFYEESLPIEPLTTKDLYYDPDDIYGSVAVRKLVIVWRRDLELQLGKQRRALARRRAAQRAEIELQRKRHVAKQPTAVDNRIPAYMKPFKRAGHTYNRSVNKPRSMNEVLKESISREFFRRFLQYHDAHIPLQFYNAVEDLKQIKETTKRNQKINKITRFYFSKDKGGMGVEALDCTADIIREIPKMQRVTPAILTSAQACVARSIEDNWYSQYLETFPEIESGSVVSHALQLLSGARQFGQERTRRLWQRFIRSILVFREGILNKTTASLFESYLKHDVKQEFINAKGGSSSYVHGVPMKKFIGNKLVDFTKLYHDLNFLAEVERFRAMCDDASEAARAGTYTIHDQELTENKARTMITCFIDSDLPPKIQINISSDCAEMIVSNFKGNMVERGLFHEATMAIFPILVHMWKHFQVNRMAKMFKQYEQKEFQSVDKDAGQGHRGTPDFFNMVVKNKKVPTHSDGR